LLTKRLIVWRWFWSVGIGFSHFAPATFVIELVPVLEDLPLGGLHAAVIALRRREQRPTPPPPEKPAIESD